MRALSIRQPYAELILRGIKTIEYRSRPTSIIGERFYIYASRTWAGVRPIASDNLVPAAPPPWLAELAVAMRLFGAEAEKLGGLPTGLIVGTAVIEKVSTVEHTPGTASDMQARPASVLSLQPYYQWHLAEVRRLKYYRKPKGHPQPVWFRG